MLPVCSTGGSRAERSASQQPGAARAACRSHLSLLTDQCCPFVRQETAALSEAQASNQALRVQLVEATSAFHHALCIAQTLLTEGAPCKHFVQGLSRSECLFFGVNTHALRVETLARWADSCGIASIHYLLECSRSACCKVEPLLLM